MEKSLLERICIILRPASWCTVLISRVVYVWCGFLKKGFSNNLLCNWGRTTSNQRWNNVVYVNIEIYNVEERWNNVVIFNVELNNVRQSRNNVVIFNVDFRNVWQRRNNVANMTIWKKIKPPFKNKIIFLSFKEYAGLKIFSFFPHFKTNFRASKILKTSNTLNDKKYI